MIRCARSYIHVFAFWFFLFLEYEEISIRKKLYNPVFVIFYLIVFTVFETLSGSGWEDADS
jgi:hypothetical protein